MHDDPDLLARARKLDPQALAEIHERYYDAIFRFISLRVGDPQTVEDLTSEVFARLLAALRGRAAPNRTLEGWLYRVAAHVVTDLYRHGYRARDVELDESLAAHEAGPPEVIEQRLAQESLRQAVGQLTAEQQTVIALRFGQERSVREAAAIMGKSEGAIKQLQARALAMLARGLTEVDGGV